MKKNKRICFKKSITFCIMFILFATFLFSACNTTNSENALYDSTETGNSSTEGNVVTSEELDSVPVTSESLQGKELVSIQWNEPQISTTEITYEEACAYMDSLYEKYEIVHVEYFIDLNYYSLSEETIDKLCDKYELEETYYGEVYGILSYNTEILSVAEKVEDEIISVEDNINSDYEEDVFAETVEADIINYVSEGRCSSLDEFMTMYPKLSEYVVDENLKQQAMVTDNMLYEYVDKRLEMACITYDIMAQMPEIVIPEDIREDFYYGYEYYDLPFYFYDIQNYEKYTSESQKAFLESSIPEFEAFLADNEEKFNQLTEIQNEIEDMKGAYYAYFEDMEYPDESLGYLYSFNSASSKGTNLETLNFLTWYFVDSIYFFNPLDPEYNYENEERELSFEEDYFIYYFVVDEEWIFSEWGYDGTAAYDKMYERFYITMPIELNWSDKMGEYPDEIRYWSTWTTEWGTERYKQEFMSVVEYFSTSMPIKTLTFDGKLLKDILPEYGFDQEWIDMWLN